MRINQHHFLFNSGLASCLAAYLFLIGCLGNRQLLETPLSQSYFLPSSPTRVWEALLFEASKPPRRILVDDESSRLLSWVSEVEPDERLHKSLTDPDVASGDNPTIAITVVQVEDSPGGSKLTIRSTYYSDKPFVGVSPSDGHNEQEILRTIRHTLIAETTSHAKSQ